MHCFLLLFLSQRQSDSLLHPSYPHMTLTHVSKEILTETNDLIFHCLKRQSNILSEDKDKIRQLIATLSLQLWKLPPQNAEASEFGRRFLLSIVIFYRLLYIFQ